MAKKKDAVFQKPSKEELKEIQQLANKNLDDKRQNLIQKMKNYFQLELNTISLIEQREQLEKAIESGVVIKDELGLVRTKRDLSSYALALHMQVILDTSKLQKEEAEFKEKWDIDKKKLKDYRNKWFIEGEPINT